MSFMANLVTEQVSQRPGSLPDDAGLGSRLSTLGQLEKTAQSKQARDARKRRFQN